MHALMPTLFLSHGAPDMLLSEDPTVAVFRGLGARLPRPSAIAVVSAHWTASPVGVTGPGDLATIHDFGGFPEALYRLDPPYCPRDLYHLDPHPHFSPRDSWVVYTSMVRGSVDVALAPVEGLTGQE